MWLSVDEIYKMNPSFFNKIKVSFHNDHKEMIYNRHINLSAKFTDYECLTFVVHRTDDVE